MNDIKNIRIKRNFGVRNAKYDNLGDIWYVKDGEPYDLVQFSIKEMEGFMWRDALCLPCGLSETEIREYVNDVSATITKSQIEEYKDFIEFGKTFGWD